MLESDIKNAMIGCSIAHRKRFMADTLKFKDNKSNSKYSKGK